MMYHVNVNGFHRFTDAASDESHAGRAQTDGESASATSIPTRIDTPS